MDVELTLKSFRECSMANPIHVARNGQEAPDYLFGEGKYADRKTYPVPNLILLDLKLPGLDGHEALDRGKETESLKR